MFDLAGKTALVTGATGGIGGSIARALYGAGATVAISGRQADKLEALAGEFGDRGHVLPCDLGNRAEVSKLIESAVAKLGRLDILVNNAGLTRDNILLRLKDDDWDAVINANHRGAFATIRAATRGMMKRRWGRIINISSVVGLIGNKGQANYAASKAGLIGLTKSVAKEFASRNILANVIAPGFIETDMTAAMTPEARAALSGQIPLERLGSVQDVANAVAFLASEQAAYITGQVLVVDGGLVM